MEQTNLCLSCELTIDVETTVQTLIHDYLEVEARFHGLCSRTLTFHLYKKIEMNFKM